MDRVSIVGRIVVYYHGRLANVCAILNDNYKDEDDVSEDEVQEEKDSSDKPLPIHKRFAKNLLNVFKKDSK